MISIETFQKLLNELKIERALKIELYILFFYELILKTRKSKLSGANLATKPIIDFFLSALLSEAKSYSVHRLNICRYRRRRGEREGGEGGGRGRGEREGGEGGGRGRGEREGGEGGGRGRGEREGGEGGEGKVREGRGRGGER